MSIEHTDFTDAESAKAFLKREWRGDIKVQTHATYHRNPFNDEAANPLLTTWIRVRNLADAYDMIDSVYNSLETHHSYDFVKTTFTVTWRFGISSDTESIYGSWKAEDDNSKVKPEYEEIVAANKESDEEE